MKVTARFFASFREITGMGAEDFEINDVSTVGSFTEIIVGKYPALKNHMNHISVAVNSEYARPVEKLHDGDEVAFLPPISGG
ncbi:MAG: molybdopterin converting factor subunit 1 [Dehalococcoidia bacterium]|nr:molybdopterin converting factor subunit 1 [Dehalococcoidia bacterium]